MNQVLKFHAYERIDGATHRKVIAHAEAAPDQFEQNRKATVICYQASGEPCTSLLDKLAYVVTIGPGDDLPPGRVRVLECCCCGNGARGRQWHNRDTGYGLCGQCAAYIQSRPDFDPDDFVSCYGIEGVHWFAAGDPRGTL